MQQLIINIQDEYKAHWLADFLHELKFVSSVETLQLPVEALPPDNNPINKNRDIDELIKSLKGSLKNTSFTPDKFYENKRQDKTLER